MVSPSSRPNPQDTHLNRARASLRQTVVTYSQHLRSAKKRIPNPGLENQLEKELAQLTTTLNKIDNYVVRIAVFGLVSRGKSAVLNALLGEKVLETGPINGVTQKPRIIEWTPKGGFVPPESALTAQNTSKVQIELIDTPGLDEVDGQTRAEMARDVSQQVDLILFIVAGDITRTEFKALCALRKSQKPLLLVFNKVDLYPDRHRGEIYESLLALEGYVGESQQLRQLISPEEIVLISADPAPMQVRVEQTDGSVSYEWEKLPPQIDELKIKILTLLNREGRSLLALNALTQARDAELRMAERIVSARNAEAEALIWKFTRYKAIAVAANPIPLLDWLGGTISDLMLIRELANLYGFPLTRYEAGKLLTTIVASSGGMLLTEICSGIFLGAGKTASAITAAENPPGLGAYAGVAVAQAGIAGYGAYAVGRAAQAYLERGCTWGDRGASTVIQEILDQVEPNTIIWRIRQELL
ncbi:MAG: GTPase [Alkalinema sp. CACIAM 70d]|nr:MAG: GTPase [Alkalinema sp. CACIAM 70d]